MNLYSDRYFAVLTYPKYNITFTDDESQELMAYSAMGYTPKEIARAMNRDEPEIILHGLYLGVLKVSRVEQKLPIQHLGTDCNPNDWNHFSSEPRTVDQIIRLEKLIQDKIWFVCHMAKRADVERGLIHVDPDKWAKELEAADQIVREQGIQNLGPYTDAQWSMLLGKLSALRWVLGHEWDFFGL